MKIGPYQLKNNLVLAPMAGVTDRPFRILCRNLGAGLAVSEMVTSDPGLWKSRKTRLRLDHSGEPGPVSVQIAGSNPERMALAAKFNVDHGAQIIDINMGCPAKKVCKEHAGSALLKDEKLVGQILDAVVSAVSVPVTLKIRTGWDTHSRNALTVSQLAENAGIQALAIHGRTRACAFRGDAEYETIARVKQNVNIPVIANGDITSPEKAHEVLTLTGADAVMIGRAAQGRPWIFKEMVQFLFHSKNNVTQKNATISQKELKHILLVHLESLYDFHGEQNGVRIARKHIGWYCKEHANTNQFRQIVNSVETASEQLRIVSDYFVDDNFGEDNRVLFAA